LEEHGTGTAVLICVQAKESGFNEKVVALVRLFVFLERVEG